MRLLMFSLAVLACTPVLAQQPRRGLLSRPLVYPGSAFDASPNYYPRNYSYPRRKAWSQQDRLLDIYEFDAITDRYDSMLNQEPGWNIISDETPQPWMYPWLFR